MYDFRKWTPQQRAAAVAQRKQRGYPWHGPPHIEAPGEYRIVTGTCFEHRSVNNPVKHGCAMKWTDWPYSSVYWYLEAKGREWLKDLWRSYPVLH